jgi:hypothetical protein
MPTAVPSTVLAAQQATVPRRRGRIDIVAELLALSPLLVLLAIAANPEAAAVDAMRSAPRILGVPVDAILGAVTIGLMLAGAVTVWKATSTVVQSVALLVFTIPATVTAVVAPWVFLALV